MSLYATANLSSQLKTINEEMSQNILSLDQQTDESNQMVSFNENVIRVNSNSARKHYQFGVNKPKDPTVSDWAPHQSLSSKQDPVAIRSILNGDSSCPLNVDS
jgi:hypothetical protein